MSRADDAQSPRAIVHKCILDAAASRPDASLDEIADEVGTATPDLVERVLDEYGDPATGTDADTSANGDVESVETDAGSTDDSESMSQNGQHTPGDADEEEITEKQRETLRIVYENPGATQETIAEVLGVSRATVSRRLGDVPGFEWADREAFVVGFFDSEADPSHAAGVDTGKGETDGTDEILVAFEERLTALEDHVAEADAEAKTGAGAGGTQVSLPPELAHKVVHACFESDRVSEDEELQLFEALLSE